MFNSIPVELVMKEDLLCRDKLRLGILLCQECIISNRLPFGASASPGKRLNASSLTRNIGFSALVIDKDFAVGFSASSLSAPSRPNVVISGFLFCQKNAAFYCGC